MGISQLLPMLENSTRPCHISEFRGRTVAVDSYCWLHRGARSCAQQLAMGEETEMHVYYCLKFVNLLLSLDIKPIMVFDGRGLPAKTGTEEKRRESKRQAKAQAVECLRLGQGNEAYKLFCQCVEVTPLMALELIKKCQEHGVDCIVAPYEADAQLAYFSLKGIADCIISEDSDLLLFGCKKVLYKMDINGAGQLVMIDKLHKSLRFNTDEYTFFMKFRHMCILSGCDYLESLPGIGLKRAHKFISTTAETDPLKFLDKVPRYLKMKHLTVTAEYKENFMVADATFLHQIVFDPFQKILIPLTPVQPDMVQYCRNAGDKFDNSLAYQLALGNLNPLTMEQIYDWNPALLDDINEYSIWAKVFKRFLVKPKRDLQLKSFQSKVLNPKTIECAKIEHDQQTAQELEFYKEPTVKPVSICINKGTDTSPKKQPKTSPILGNNPFLKRNISKFQATQIVAQQKVMSRFFSSHFVGPREFRREFNSSFSSVGDDDSAIGSNDHLEEEEMLLTPPRASIVPNASTEAHTVEYDVEMEELSKFEYECNKEGEAEFDINGPSCSTLSSVENLPNRGAGMKRCNSDNKKPAPKKLKKQLTILDVFGKMKMR